MNKDLKIVLTNYLALIESILSNCSLSHDLGAIIKLKNDKKIILKALGDISDKFN